MVETQTNPHVKAAIDLCGGKQALLAEKLGCAQQTVSKLLLGEIEIDPTWAVRLSRATDGGIRAADACPELAALLVEQLPHDHDNRRHASADDRPSSDPVEMQEASS